MSRTVDELRRRMASQGLEASSTEEVFDLLLAACSECCSGHSGGNKECPPPPKISL